MYRQDNAERNVKQRTNRQKIGQWLKIVDKSLSQTGFHGIP